MSGLAGLPRGSDPVRSDDLLEALAAVGVSEVDGDVAALRARVAQIEIGVVELGEAVLSDATPADVGTDTAGAGVSDDVSRADHGHRLDEATAALIPSSDEKDALDGAAAPGADNAFATIADLPVADNVAALDMTASVADADDLQTVADKVDQLIAALVAAGQMTAPTP